jgi:peroxin-4
MDPVSRRLLKELNDYQREAHNHPEIKELCPADDEDLTHWRATIAGLDQTPFQGECVCRDICNKQNAATDVHHTSLLGGIWNLDVKIPHNYPMQPPTVKFITQICHPNIHFKVLAIDRRYVCFFILQRQSMY